MEHLRIRCPCCDSIFEQYPERKIILDKTKKKSLSKPQTSVQKDDWTKSSPQGIKIKSVDIKEVLFEPQSPNSYYEALPKVCPRCKSELVLNQISSGGDDLLYCLECDWVEDFNKPIL